MTPPSRHPDPIGDPVSQVRLRVVPCPNDRAKRIVDSWHRHHGSAVQARFSLAAVDPDGVVHGAAMVGRPVARLLDDGWTLEVNRVATDGTPNACSLLYGASRRVAKEMGYAKLITYIRQDEPGTSLKAAGWVFEEPIRARSWNMPGRVRIDKTDIVQRGRWATYLGESFPVLWPTETEPQPDTLFPP